MWLVVVLVLAVVMRQSQAFHGFHATYVNKIINNSRNMKISMAGTTPLVANGKRIEAAPGSPLITVSSAV